MNKPKRPLYTLHAALCIAVFAAQAANAATAYLTANDTYEISSFTNPAPWSVYGVPSPDNDYVVKDGHVICPPMWYSSESPSVFNGHSLRIGEVGGTDGTLACFPAAAGATVTFANDGIILANGTLCNWYGYSLTVLGNVEVTSSDTAPFCIYANQNEKNITFAGTVTGTAGTGLWLYSRVGPGRDSWSQQHFICHFTNDSLAGYYGTIYCHQWRNTYVSDPPSESIRTEFASDTGSFPGKLVLDYNCAIRGETAASVVSVGTLEMKTNSCIQVVYDKTTKKASQVKVTDSFLHSSGKVRVLFSSPHSTGTYSDSNLVPPLPILKAPAGVTLDAADFALETATFPSFSLYVETDADDGLSTLYLKQHGKVVTLDTSDTSGDHSTFAFGHGDHWSDGLDPSPDKDYYANGKTLYAYTDAGSTFAGHVLAMQGGTFSLSESVTINDFRTVGTFNNVHISGNGKNLSGHITHSPDTPNPLIFSEGANRTFGLFAQIEGKGEVDFMHTGNSRKPVTFWLPTANTNFSGRIKFFSAQPAYTDWSICAKIGFTTVDAFGGPMKSWTYNGHTLQHYSQLEPNGGPHTLDRPNCGLFVDGNGTIVAPGVGITLLERITWNGCLRLFGGNAANPGRFKLGGEAPFFTTDGGTTPVAGKNRLWVNVAILVPLSSEVFQGVNVDFSANMGVEITVPERSDSGLGRYGMHNTLIDNPFTFADDKLKVTIVDPNGATSPSVQTGRGKVIVPICTVNATAAETLRGKINLASQPYANVIGQCIEEVTNQDGSITFRAKLITSGTIISIR